MPKQTFRNLPEEKRNALVNLGLEEFARNDYASASISRIVERAGIAKGSIYQYFSGKEAMFNYLVDLASQTLLRYVQSVLLPGGGKGMFDALRSQMKASVGAALRFPLHAQLVARAYTSPLPFHSKIVEQGKQTRLQFFRQFVVDAKAAGEIAPAVDVDVAALVISAVMGELGPFVAGHLGLDAGLGEAAWAQLNSPQVERTFDQVIAILKKGFAGRSLKRASRPGG